MIRALRVFERCIPGSPHADDSASDRTDLDADVHGRNVLIVEDIIDSGLTLHWLRENLLNRGAKSVAILTVLRKPDAAKVDVDVNYVGFDIPNEFVIGYGLDFAEDYRHLPFIGTLARHVYEVEGE